MADFQRLPDRAMVVLRHKEGKAHRLPAVGWSLLRGRDRIIAIGPDEWLIVAADDDDGALLARIAALEGLAIDVSGNRAVCRSGMRFLQNACPYDVGSMVADAAISTVLARAQVIVVKETEPNNFLVLPRRSFVHYLEQLSLATGA